MFFQVICVLSLFLTSAFSMIPVEPTLDSRIWGGANATYAGFASIKIPIPQFTGYIAVCGGFIINQFWVGTAAQCVYRQTNRSIYIGVGSHLVNDAEHYEVSDIKVHEQFDAETLFSDIAVVKTATEIIFSSLVAQVALDSALRDTAINVNIYGFGQTGGCSLSSILQQNVFTLVPLRLCQNNFPVVARKYITDSHICASFVGRAACSGDAGGPIIYSNRVIGILSWVEPCLAGQTNVNTRISSYYNWIIDRVAIDTEDPTTVSLHNSQTPADDS